jgi:pantothenate kinase-related protein Tda10
MRSEVMKSIVEVLSSNVQMDSEVQNVREWLQTQNADLAVKSLHTAMEESYQAFDNRLKPQRIYLEKLKKHNAGFINDAITDLQFISEQI